MLNNKVKNLVSSSELARICGISAAATTRARKNALKDASYGTKIDIEHPLVQEYIKKHAKAKKKEPIKGIDELYESALNFCIESGKVSIRFIADNFDIPKRRAEKIAKQIKATGLVKPIDNEPKAPKPKVLNGNKKAKQTKLEADRKRLLDQIENGETLHKVPEDIEEFADMTLREIYTRFGTEAAFNEFLKALKSIEDINSKRIANAEKKKLLVSRDIVKRGIIEPFDAMFVQLLTDGSKKLSARIPSMIKSGKSEVDIEKYISSDLTSFIRPVKQRVERIIKDMEKELEE